MIVVMKGRPPITQSPQEKKALSYARDRRNCYGESPHAARIAIPARKAAENRTSRRGVAQDLKVIDRLDDVEAEVRESEARQNLSRVGGWTKWRDQPLGEHIATRWRLRPRRALLRQPQGASPKADD